MRCAFDINQGNKREAKQKEKILGCFLLQLNLTFPDRVEILGGQVVESLIDPKDYGAIFPSEREMCSGRWEDKCSDQAVTILNKNLCISHFDFNSYIGNI